MKEATARIKINRLLENAGRRFFADETGPANIRLEPKVRLTEQALDALGLNFEKSGKGFIDFLLLNEKSFPAIAKFTIDNLGFNPVEFDGIGTAASQRPTT
jgi:type I restriction enzyme R subunit